MSFLAEEDCQQMWSAAQEYRSVLENLKDGGEVAVGEIHDLLGNEHLVDEAVDRLQATGLLRRANGSTEEAEYYIITGYGSKILGYETSQDWIEEMPGQDFKNTYGDTT